MSALNPHAGISLTTKGEAYALAHVRPAGCPDGVDPVKWRRAIERRCQKLADTQGELKKLHARHRERQQEITRLQTAAEKAATTSRETIEGLRLRVSQLEEQLKTALDEVDEWKSWAEEEGIEFEEVDGQ
mgnify:CR=1 FL=1